MANVTKKSERKDRTLAIVIMSASVLFTGITAGNAITNNTDSAPVPHVVESANSSDNETEWISVSQNGVGVGSTKSIGSIPGK